MSALLSLNPIPLISWKGNTFNQISSSIQKNGQLSSDENIFLKTKPLKHYRREIANIDNPSCSSNSSIKIDVVNRPSGTIINSTATNKGGLENLIDITLPNNTCETYENCSVVLSPAENARKRVRSSGMIKRKFIDGTFNDRYYTTSSQYLSSRNLTFAQNQYNYIRQGDSTAKPGTSLASANVYIAQGLNQCQKYHIVENTQFIYKWIVNNTEYIVTIPTGYYSLEDLNRIFKQQMFSNLHYFIKDQVGNNNEYYISNISYAMQFAYNNNSNVIEFKELIGPIEYLLSRKDYINYVELDSLGKIKFIRDYWDEEYNSNILEEFYNRVKYVNLYYLESIDKGWKSDRGRIYINFMI